MCLGDLLQLRWNIRKKGGGVGGWEGRCAGPFSVRVANLVLLFLSIFFASHPLHFQRDSFANRTMYRMDGIVLRMLRLFIY